MSDYDVTDWAAFENLNGEPLSIAGTACDRLSEQQERKIFFRRSGEKLNQWLSQTDNIDEQIDRLLFARYDAQHRQIEDPGEKLAQGFLQSIDERLRSAYEDKLDRLRTDVERLPADEAIKRLQTVRIDEQQRYRSDASPEVDVFLGRVDNEIERCELHSGLDDQPARATARDATKKQLQHLKTARQILGEDSEFHTREDFEAACKKKGEPGGSVRKRVQELGKERLNTVYLPEDYTGFSGGFQRLVEDLWKDSLTS